MLPGKQHIHQSSFKKQPWAVKENALLGVGSLVLRSSPDTGCTALIVSGFCFVFINWEDGMESVAFCSGWGLSVGERIPYKVSKYETLSNYTRFWDSCSHLSPRDWGWVKRYLVFWKITAFRVLVFGMEVCCMASSLPMLEQEKRKHGNLGRWSWIFISKSKHFKKTLDLATTWFNNLLFSCLV